MRSCQAERLAAETVDERESRLQQMRDRLAAKSVEGMEMRLQQMSSSQRERLAAWNAEEREIRIQHDREPQGAPRKSLERGYSTACCTSQDAKIPCTNGCTGGVPYSQNHLPATPHLE